MRKRTIGLVGGVVLLGAVAWVPIGCVNRSGGTWAFDSAPLPEGWPELTPVGEVQVKEYPTYRAATVRDADLERDGMGPMFNELFGHIKERDIAMTAPVDMGYERDASGETTMASMAFLYRSPELGQTGEDGVVRVEDLPAQTFATIGVRGGYTDTRFEKNLDTLAIWASSQEAWRVVGEPRYLGYNGPFTPAFWRYGEVQIPVERVADEGG